MYEEQFSKRLAELRTKKGVSARDMSLSIGQNPGYIRAIECGTTFPTMSNFFYICEYLNVTPTKKHSILASSALYGEVKCCAVFYHATARAE